MAHIFKGTVKGTDIWAEPKAIQVWVDDRSGLRGTIWLQAAGRQHIRLTPELAGELASLLKEASMSAKGFGIRPSSRFAS